ncbi:MAG: class I SAM-dependent methyltransferase [Simkaniaceae bacterium]
MNSKKLKFSFLFFILLAKIAFCNTEEIFTNIYEKKLWKDSESVSGPGSNLYAARIIRSVLPEILQKFKCHSILDAPCGDFNWMRTVDLSNYEYIGVDIVEPLIEANQQKYSDSNISFIKLNLIDDELPTVDIIICRDLLVHFPFEEIFKTIKNFKRSKSTYLLMNTYTDPKRINNNIKMGNWRPLNFQKPPFNFPKPIFLINEQYSKHPDRHLALWRIKDL